MSTQESYNKLHQDEASHAETSWLETWWPLLVIIVGLSLFSIFAMWKPTTV